MGWGGGGGRKTPKVSYPCGRVRGESEKKRGTLCTAQEDREIGMDRLTLKPPKMVRHIEKVKMEQKREKGRQHQQGLSSLPLPFGEAAALKDTTQTKIQIKKQQRPCGVLSTGK